MAWPPAHVALLTLGNALLAVCANVAARHSAEDARFTVTAFALNTASYSLVPFVYAAMPFAVAQVTVSSATALLATVAGWTVFGEAMTLRRVVAVLVVVAGNVLMHVDVLGAGYGAVVRGG